jgi:TPP-dependent pyruvate/acetoin dehydrogenase alpha subunit
LYRSLYRIRRVEEEIVRVYPTDVIKSPVHLSIGQEAVSVAVCEALRPQDAVFGTYRGHALYLAKGGDLNRMIAELYGKSTGCARGKGGSMHLVDVEHGVMGTSAVVATTIPEALGMAIAFQYRREPRVAVCFLGDGATEEGVFFETLNFAALRKAPLIMICENNCYAIHTPLHRRQAQVDLCRKAEAMGVPAVRFETDDVWAIHQRVSDTASRLRADAFAGPQFFEVPTCRWKEHVGPGDDFHLAYRDEATVRQCQAHDQLKKLAAVVPAAVREEIEGRAEAEIARAFALAADAPFPAEADLFADVYRET